MTAPMITPFKQLSYNSPMGGGLALPPYLQTRKPVTQPVVTPKSTAVPGEAVGGGPSVQPMVPGAQGTMPPKPGPSFGGNITDMLSRMRLGGGAPKPATGGVNLQNILGSLRTGLGGKRGTPAIAPKTPQPNINAQPNVAGGNTPNVAGTPGSPGGGLQDVYDFFKQDLENQQNQALANTKTDAAARGVYYGTPLTGSQADIRTQYLRGLGQLQAGMYGNEQQAQLARLGLATNMLWSMPQMGAQGINPQIFQMLGQLYGNPANSAVASQRGGPAIAPASG